MDIHNVGTFMTFGLGVLFCWAQSYITLRVNLRNEGRIVSIVRFLLSGAVTLSMILCILLLTISITVSVLLSSICALFYSLTHPVQISPWRLRTSPCTQLDPSGRWSCSSSSSSPLLPLSFVTTASTWSAETPLARPKQTLNCTGTSRTNCRTSVQLLWHQVTAVRSRPPSIHLVPTPVVYSGFTSSGMWPVHHLCMFDCYIFSYPLGS